MSQTVRRALVGIGPELGRDVELHQHLGQRFDRRSEEVDVTYLRRFPDLVEQRHPVRGHRVVLQLV
jgi:hypothetical protein